MNMLRRTFIGTLAVMLGLPGFALARGGGRGRGSSRGSSGGSHPVRPYTRRDGTYVPGHRQTNPDSTKRNNWSSKPNMNPYTGKAGTKDPNR
jgi:hypothetical protein